MIKRFYCSEEQNKTTGKMEYRFKEAKKKRYLVFATQKEAISHLKSLKVNAVMWFRQNQQFVSSVKTTQNDFNKKTDEIEIKYFDLNKKTKVKSKEVKKEEIDLLIQADNIFIEEAEESKSKRNKEKVTETIVEPAVTKEAKKETAVLLSSKSSYWGLSISFVLFTIAIVVFILAMFVAVGA